MRAMRFVFNLLAKCVTSSWKSRGANTKTNTMGEIIQYKKLQYSSNHHAVFQLEIVFMASICQQASASCRTLKPLMTH